MMKTRFMCTHKAWRYCSAEEERIIVEDTDGFVHWQQKSERKSTCSQPAADGELVEEADPGDILERTSEDGFSDVLIYKCGKAGETAW